MLCGNSGCGVVSQVAKNRPYRLLEHPAPIGPRYARNRGRWSSPKGSCFELVDPVDKATPSRRRSRGDFGKDYGRPLCLSYCLEEARMNQLIRVEVKDPCTARTFNTLKPRSKSATILRNHSDMDPTPNFVEDFGRGFGRIYDDYFDPMPRLLRRGGRHRLQRSVQLGRILRRDNHADMYSGFGRRLNLRRLRSRNLRFDNVPCLGARKSWNGSTLSPRHGSKGKIDPQFNVRALRRFATE
jgi:hypothetical protein